MCTNYTPTKNADWVKVNFGVDLPNGYPDEAYPNFLGPVVVKSHQTQRVASGLARFGLIFNQVPLVVSHTLPSDICS
jgi:hypothetical protein